jgi:hypothetical protein
MQSIYRIACAAVLALLAACGSMTRPNTAQLVLSDPPLFLVTSPLRYSLNDGADEIVVPIGFVTDLASIPRELWWWQSPHEATMAPAIIHDYLYWEQSCTKDEADAVMYLAMEDLSAKDYKLVYMGVRSPLAASAWKRNDAARRGGETRFLTRSYAKRLSDGFLDKKSTWASIQEDARVNAGLYSPSLPNLRNKQVCGAALENFLNRPVRLHGLKNSPAGQKISY